MEPAFDLLFNLTSDAAFVDLDGRIVAVNQAGLDLYDCSPDYLMGAAVVDLVPVELRDRLAGRARRRRDQQERPRADVEEIQQPNGRRIPVSLRSCPIEFDGREAVLVLLRPLHELEAAEELVEHQRRRDQTFTDVSLQLAMASEQDLDRTIERTLGAIASSEQADRAYVIEFHNDQQLITCTHEWCGAGIEAQIDYVRDLRTSEFEWSFSELCAGRSVHMPDLTSLPAAADAERQSFGQFGVRSVLQVPMLVGGDVIGLLGFNSVHRAVTWSDDTIRLVRRVADATATVLTRRRAAESIRDGQRAAESANAAKTSFLSRMSHELRTPLNAVLGFSELLLVADDARSDRDRELLNQVLDSGRHLLALVEDVLDISRIEAGGLSVSIETVDLADVVANATAIIERSGHVNDVEIDISQVLVGSYVEADRQRVQQVLVNVLSNACKYNRPGGSVTVTATPQGPEMRLVISDTGIGIEAGALDRVFEPFDRLGAEETGVDGVGIGLSLTKMLVDLMGGEIAITSTQGVGTDVQVVLPRPEIMHTTAVPGQARTGPALVLAVEDNEASSLLLQHIVDRVEGAEFATVPSIAGALREMAARPPALVLLDLHLEDGSGEDLLARMRADDHTKAIPVFVITANADPDARSRVIAAGADQFMTKPVAVGALTEAIAEAISPAKPEGAGL